MSAALAGYIASLSLIVAIGAQNAYILRLGLSRSHIGIAVALCASAIAVMAKPTRPISLFSFAPRALFLSLSLSIYI
jgi:arginine exporter protein ArgO